MILIMAIGIDVNRGNVEVVYSNTKIEILSEIKNDKSN